MPAYLLNIKEFTDRSQFDDDRATELEAKRTGWLMTNILRISADIDARLVKRGDIQANGGCFLAPYPDKVKGWVARILTPLAYSSLGIVPTLPESIWDYIVKDAERADAEITEAANPVTGLLILPIQNGSPKEQATEPTTLFYAEQSPFTSKHRQGDVVGQNRRYG